MTRWPEQLNLFDLPPAAAPEGNPRPAPTGAAGCVLPGACVRGASARVRPVAPERAVTAPAPAGGTSTRPGAGRRVPGASRRRIRRNSGPLPGNGDDGDRPLPAARCREAAAALARHPGEHRGGAVTEREAARTFALAYLPPLPARR